MSLRTGEITLLEAVIFASTFRSSKSNIFQSRPSHGVRLSSRVAARLKIQIVLIVKAASMKRRKTSARLRNNPEDSHILTRRL